MRLIMKRTLVLSLLSLSALVSANYAAETIHMKKGDSYILKLESNPTTGYMWELTSLGKENKLQVEELPFKPANKGLVGQGGTQSWKITANSKGLTRAVFDYKQSWESNSIKTEIFDFIVE